jgi:hypothetical protein
VTCVSNSAVAGVLWLHAASNAALKLITLSNLITRDFIPSPNCPANEETLSSYTSRKTFYILDHE